MSGKKKTKVLKKVSHQVIKSYQNTLANFTPTWTQAKCGKFK